MQESMENLQETTVAEADKNSAKNLEKEKKRSGRFKAISFIVIGILIITNIVTAAMLINGQKWSEYYEYENNLFDENGFVSVKVGEKWGFADEKGKIIINPQFDKVGDFNEGLYAVMSNDKIGYIDTEGKFVINAQFDDASDFIDGLAAVQSGEKWGYINKSGKYVINPQFDSARSFQEGMAVVEVDGKYGVINKNGEYVINPQFEYCGYYHNGLFDVEIADNNGFVDKTGDYVINAQYPRASDMKDDGYAIVATRDKKYIIIDRNGKQIGTTSFDGIGSMDDGFCKQDGCYSYTWGDDYCSKHEKTDTTYYPYCEAYGCINRAYYGDYCTEHNYLE